MLETDQNPGAKPTPPSPEAAHAGHEPQPAPHFRPILLTVGVLLVAAALMHVGLALLQGLLLRRDGGPVQVADNERFPAPPRLTGLGPLPGAPLDAQQPVPPGPDPSGARGHAGASFQVNAPAPPAPLDGYGWVDKEKGIVRLPVEKAMTLFVQRQQGKAPAPSAAAQPGQVQDAASGRFAPAKEKP